MNLPSTIFLLNILIGTFEISIQISGGRRVRRRCHTNTISIMRSGKIICQGGFLSETHVFTAASCVSGFHESAFAVIGGRMDVPNAIPEWRGVERIHLHPNFSTFSNEILEDSPHVFRENDIAVLKIIHPFIRTERFALVESELHNTEDINLIQRCGMSGWEKVEEPSPIGAHLKVARIRTLSYRENELQGIILRRNQFAGEVRGIQAALTPEDYGSPLVCDGVIVGILISTISTPSSQSIFLAVAPYSIFFNQVIHN